MRLPRIVVAVALVGVTIMALSSFFGAAGGKPADAAPAALPKPELDLKADQGAPAGTTRSAVFGAGCFWCVEGVFEQFEGVKDAVSGYAGGTKETANYKAVCTGTTAHAEVVKIDYDPSKITYGGLLQILFASHDPTTKDAQGPDHGPQYRSAIFYQNDEEKRVAEAYIKQLDAAKAFADPIVTTLEPLKPDGFYAAEAYHQDYAVCNPNQGYIRAIALPKIVKARKQFKDQLKPETQPAAK